MSWLTGWTYRKSITVSRASGAVTNYQMKLLVGESSGAVGEDVDCNSHCATDFDDLRFTAADATTVLDYWIETTSGTTPNQLATVWIEFNSIGTGATTFYMYYGKADATAVSNGDNTFLLFDHFTALDTVTKWTNTGSYTQGGSEVGKAAANTNTTYILVSQATYTGPLAIETRCRVGTDWADPETGWHFAVAWDSGWAQTGYFAGHYLTTGDNSIYIFKFSTGATNNKTAEAIYANTYYRYSLRVGATNQFAFVDDTQKATIAVGIQTNPNNIVLGCGRGPSVSDYSTYFDWVAVRNYQNTEPAWGSWGDEESSDTDYTQTQSRLFTTPGTANFTVPAGVSLVWVSLLAGGGGGAGGGVGDDTTYNGTGGGGGGAGMLLGCHPVTVSGGETVLVTIGAAGTGGASALSATTGRAGNNGTAGGNTSFGAYVVAYGGSFGVSGEDSANGGAGGAGGGLGPVAAGGSGGSPTGNTGTDAYYYISYKGSSGAGGGQGGGYSGASLGPGGVGGTGKGPYNGGAGGSDTNYVGGGGGGGASAKGTGGAGGSSTDSTHNGNPGSVATGYGAGGGGGSGSFYNYNSGAGANGTAGWLLVEWVS